MKSFKAGPFLAKNFMELAYVYERDASSPDVQSGRPGSILREFRRAGLTVHHCFPLTVGSGGIVDRLGRRLAKLAGRRYLAGRSPRHLRQMAGQVDAALRGLSVDFVFCPGTLPIAYLRTDRPIAVSSDATFHAMVGYYAEYSGLSMRQMHAAHKAEQSALRRAELLVYSSGWAANSAITAYGVPAERVTVIPSGANIGRENEAPQVREFIARRSAARVDFLFVGKDWSRKGGAICLEAVRLLNQRGVDAHLDVVGCKPPVPADCQSWVHCHGVLRSSVPSEKQRLVELFQTAHFLFVPSRAETFGMTFCEANAFGVPCITTETGGIPTIVKHGINGVMLPLAAGPEDYVRAIGALIANREAYRTLAMNSFFEFEQRLNWRVWMREFLPSIEAVLARRRPGARLRPISPS